MKDMGGITAKVNLPPVTQIGVVVRDLDQAMGYYSKTLGLGPFNPVFELAPDKSWAKSTYFDTQRTGGIIMEVIYRPWLAKH